MTKLRYINCTKHTFSAVFIFSFIMLISSCSTTQSNNTNIPNIKNTIYYVQTDESDRIGKKSTYKTENSPWKVRATISKKQEKPRIFFYNFEITSPDNFIISDINYKYGIYGKWRIIKKQQYLNNDNNKQLKQKKITVRDFPITIKRIGSPHNQLVKLTLINKKNQKQDINLIFGVQKCLSKNENEFVCF